MIKHQNWDLLCFQILKVRVNLQSLPLALSIFKLVFDSFSYASICSKRFHFFICGTFVMSCIFIPVSKKMKFMSVLILGLHFCCTLSFTSPYPDIGIYSCTITMSLGFVEFFIKMILSLACMYPLTFCSVNLLRIIPSPSHVFSDDPKWIILLLRNLMFQATAFWNS